MSRESYERTFRTALANEFQWRNLYLKEFGCCTYPPPIAKDPSTTAHNVYPMRRQAILLQRESSSSSNSSEGAGDNVEDDDHYDESTVDTDREESYQPNRSSVLPEFCLSGGDSDRPNPKRHQSHYVGLAGAEDPCTSDSPRDCGTADQFFSLDMSFSVDGHGARTHSFRRPVHSSGARRLGHGAVLRKDDFFDTNDVFSTKFFSFLWLNSDTDNDDDESASGTRTVDHERRRWEARDAANGQGTRHRALNSKNPSLLTLSRPDFSSLANQTFDTNPHGLPEAVLRLHHETWALLMDNRLMAWVHREAADHCQRATQLRQRLLEIIALGPSSADVAGSTTFASPTHVSSALAVPEDALQRTLESFSPFFVVISPPAVVQRAVDQFQAARRGQLRSVNGHQPAATAVADLVGLPLLSQYGSWREAYEHRHRWDKAPFSFFFIHDVSYNYAQVTAMLVELQLLYTHAHTHSRLCVEARRESVFLQNAARQLTTSSSATCNTEERRHTCPLMLIQEMTESIILAYEQSSTRTTLSMLRRVLDFLTDAALDTVTAHRFISRMALLRQHQFQLPGMDTTRPSPASTTAPAFPTAAAFNATQVREGDTATAGKEDRQSTRRNLSVSKMEDGASTSDELSGTGASGVLNIDLEPQRVTERDINALFEIAYWFVDVTTANAKVPLDPALIASATAPLSAARVEPLNNRLGVFRRVSRSSPGSRSPLDTMLYQVEGSHLASPRHGNALSPTGADDPSLSLPPRPQPQPYLPGRAQMYNPVESLVEAVVLLEVYQKPLHLRDDRPDRVGRKKRQSVLPVDVKARRGDRGSGRFTSSSLAPAPISDTFASFISPLVVLTTYLRLHGGNWLKQLCRRVFESLHRPNVQLYVNTLELDATWAALQPSPSPSAQDAFNGTDTAATRGSQRQQIRLPGGAPSAPNTAANKEVARCDFLYRLGTLEDLICQDILYALNNFFGFLYGKRAAERLPQGISALLTQFVSTVHLHMLESVGATRAAAAASSGNSHHNRPRRPGTRASSTTPVGGMTADAPSRIAEDCLRVCRQRYYAGLRRRGGAGESGAPHTPAFCSVDVPVTGTSGRATPEAAAPAAAASLPRLLHTIEQHRLGKFILFDCWILPALNNAVSLGFLASDSPMHLRWNVDALARYLKILVHAPFVEQDKMDFASLSRSALEGVRRRRSSNVRCNDGGGSKGGRGTDTEQEDSKPGTHAGGRGAARPTVLSLPPYLTGIYDVATGSLVRMQTSISMITTAGCDPSNTVLTAPAAAAHPTTLSTLSSTLSSPVVNTVGYGEFEDGEALSTRDTKNNCEDVSMMEESPTQWGQSRRSLEATAPPSSVTVAYETPSLAAPQRHSEVPRAVQRRGSAAASIKLTVTPPSGSSSRLFSTEGEAAAAAAEMSSPSMYLDTDSFAGPPRDLHGNPLMSSPGSQRNAEMPLSSATPLAPLPPLDFIPSATAAVAHPYVVMDDAVWLDMSPVLQSLNDRIGLKFCDHGTGEALASDSETATSITQLPTMNNRGGGVGPPADGALMDSVTLTDLSLLDVPALQILNNFTYAACTDDSDHVVVPEFEVLPSMAAGCLEKLYELATDTHPMVAHALQKGTFHFAYKDPGRAPSGLTSLYTACMNGVLLHPRTAAHVLKNTMDNNAPFSRMLLKPVADTTALDLLGRLATYSRDVPMVDVNAVVPLMNCMVPTRSGTGGGGPHARMAFSPSSTTLPAVGARNPSAASTSATVSHRWERESRRLLREFVFLTTGNADCRSPLPLVPGLRRPVGPPHPAHMIRAGAARIMEDTGGLTPMVFDPWWRAMVVALCVKASNMFAECSGDQSVSFQEMCHGQAEESQRLHRCIAANFVNTKGRDACEEDAMTTVSRSSQRQISLTERSSGVSSLPLWPSRRLKQKSKAGRGRVRGSGAAKSTGTKRGKNGRKAAAAAAT
ncbi:hypothetical protein NXY56_003068 [Leishmania guyanensis]|uniref:Uncharacterized protein n=1 Tax=Leishmania guyanensis TaxID=5670 RepID=A0A1E1IWS1_LEIGU|nr:hypothetical protein, conserved [Leishmania guyanensis]